MMVMVSYQTFGWACFLALSIIDATLIIKPKTHKWGLRLLPAIPLIAIMYAVMCLIESGNIKLIRFYEDYADNIAVALMFALLGVGIVYLISFSIFDDKKIIKRLSVTGIYIGSLLFSVVAFIVIMYPIEGQTVRNNLTYETRNIPIAKYNVDKINNSYTTYKLLTKNGKQITVNIGDDDVPNKLKVKHSLKYTKPKLVLTKYTVSAKNADYLKKVHAENDKNVTQNYYVITHYKPLKGIKN